MAEKDPFVALRPRTQQQAQHIEMAEKDPFVALRPRTQQQAQHIEMAEWETHFTGILNVKNKQINEAEESEDQGHNIEYTDWTPLKPQEVRKLIMQGKNKKAAGPDGIYYEHLKSLSQILNPIWTKLYNKCLELGRIPQQWRKSTIKVLYKGKGDREDPNKYRGVALESVLFKILTKIITINIAGVAEEMLPDAQMGFRRGRSTTTAVGLLLNNIEEALQKHNKLYAVFVDFTKAFDLMDRGMIMA